MISRRDVLVFGVILLLALVAALATYVLGDLLQPELAAVIATPTAHPPTPTATASPTAMPAAEMPATETPAPTETPTPTPIPQFGPVTFGLGMSADKVLKPGSSFPAGTQVVYAAWSYQDMSEGAAYAVSWLLDETPWSYESLTWDGGRYGSKGAAYVVQIAENDADGLPPGNYRLELFLGERLAQLATFVVLGPTSTPVPPTATPQPDLQTIGRSASRALVELQVPLDSTGYSGGSGSIVDGRQGLILTNWHVVGEYGTDELANEGGYAQVWLTLDPDRAPEFTYWAQVVAQYSDIYYDLAILRITHEKDRRTLVQGPLNLPSVALGDSDRVHRGDHVLLLGYPDYARGTLSWTEGIIATRDDEEKWIKSDAGISHGHSGGMMLNAKGELIGIPSQYEETSVGGILARARPINLAKGLIQGAIAGLQPLPDTPSHVDEPKGVSLVVLAAPSLNLRSGPNLQSRVVGEMQMGTRVDVVGAPEWDGERYWQNVQDSVSGKVGWASDAYLASWDIARTPILFSSDRSGDLDIYRIYPDGTGLTRLTSAAGDEGDASWSPDRNYVVFTYGEVGNSDLYYMPADGSSWFQLTGGPADDVHPVWSPDGGRIAFVSNRDGDWEIYVLDLSDNTVEQLTFNQDWDSFPAWSPDGTRIVFTSRRTGNYDLFVVDTVTGAETRLTNSPYSDAHPSWSPAGDEIAYTMVVAEGGKLRREIGVVSLYDPAHPRRVTQGEASKALHRYPDWSPDGQWIVFESEQDGNTEVYVIPARGGIMANLTLAPRSGDTAPAWAR